MASVQQELVILDGPGLLELQFSDYNPQGHVVSFTVDSPRCLAPGEFRQKAPWTMHAQVTGTGRVERPMNDPLGRRIPGSARLIRLTYNGIFRFRGWFDPHERKGYLTAAGRPGAAPVPAGFREVRGSGSGIG